MSAGFALTFDDDYIYHWQALRPLLREFDVRASFFVRGFDLLDRRQLDWLRELRDDGHEIGCHTHRHKSVINDYGADPARLPDYLREQVLPAIECMQAAGFPVQSFAYPFGHRSAAWDAELLKHFRHLRGTAYKRPLRPLKHLAPIYNPPGQGRRLHFAIGIDNSYGISQKELRGGLERAKASGTVIGFYAHRPVEVDTAYYVIRPSVLRNLFEAARATGLRSYTVAELG